MSFESIHKKLHPQLQQLMQNRKDSVLTTSEINNIYKQTYPGSYPESYVDWLRPTDHCINKTCTGACWCTMTENAIFEYLKRGSFRVR